MQSNERKSINETLYTQIAPLSSLGNFLRNVEAQNCIVSTDRVGPIKPQTHNPFPSTSTRDAISFSFIGKPVAPTIITAINCYLQIRRYWWMPNYIFLFPAKLVFRRGDNVPGPPANALVIDRLSHVNWKREEKIVADVMLHDVVWVGQTCWVYL